MIGYGKGDMELAKRRVALAALYASLPPLTSPNFWMALDDPTLPLEVLVRVLRMTTANEYPSAQQRVSTLIVERVQRLNFIWAKRVVSTLLLSEPDRQVFAHDLCADLHETLLRALYDPQRHFWEENFLHALTFERKHVLRSFMIREGFWMRTPLSTGTLAAQSDRVPRTLISSLDRPRLSLAHSFDEDVREIEDETALRMFFLVEHADLFQTVLQLPEPLKAIILLLFWEERTEKEVARILSISERTVRNRLRSALRLLQTMLVTEGENISHA